jgi:hypothetical protein
MGKQIDKNFLRVEISDNKSLKNTISFNPVIWLLEICLKEIVKDAR